MFHKDDPSCFENNSRSLKVTRGVQLGGILEVQERDDFDWGRVLDLEMKKKDTFCNSVLWR